MNLEETDSVYFIGVGGIGMSALARYFRSLKKNVGGYDRTETALTQELVKEGIQIHYDDAVSLIPQVFKNAAKTLVVYTPAVPTDHSEFLWFTNHAFDIKKRAEVLGIISRSKDVIAIAGTHGKTTTSTMVSHLLKNSLSDCNAFLGGISLNYHNNLLLSEKSNCVVVEADEYDRSFLQLNPKGAVITSMDADHLDIYGTLDAYREAFELFALKIKPGGFLVIKEGLNLHEKPVGVAVYTYALRGNADFHAEDIRAEDGFYHFSVVTPSGIIKNLKLGFPGILNVENAVAAIAVAYLLDSTETEIRKAIESFKGVKRRFEYHIKSKNLVYIDDYGHHPEELRYTIESVKELYPGRKVTGIFQPHLYSRTRDFAEDFARSLSLLDEAILLDIYPAREMPIPGVTSEMLLSKVRASGKHHCSKSQLLPLLKSMPLPEVMITMGAGDIDTLIEPIKNILLEKQKNNG